MTKGKKMIVGVIVGLVILYVLKEKGLINLPSTSSQEEKASACGCGS